jgi:hypothetical protein
MPRALIKGSICECTKTNKQSYRLSVMRLLVRKVRYITHISLLKRRSQYFNHVFLKSHKHFQI